MYLIAEASSDHQIHQNHQISSKFTSFHQFMTAVNLVVALFSRDHGLAQGLLLVKPAWRWHGISPPEKREARNGMNYEIASVEPIEQIFAAGVPFLLAAASV